MLKICKCDIDSGDSTLISSLIIHNVQINISINSDVVWSSETLRREGLGFVDTFYRDFYYFDYYLGNLGHDLVVDNIRVYKISLLKNKVLYFYLQFIFRFNVRYFSVTVPVPFFEHTFLIFHRLFTVIVTVLDSGLIKI